MKQQRTSRSKHVDFMILDLLCIEVSFFAAMLIRFRTKSGFNSDDYLYINMLIVCIHVFLVFLTEPYSGVLKRGYLKELRQTVIHNFLLAGVLLSALYFMKRTNDYSRLVTGYFLVINTVLMTLLRCIHKKILYTRNTNPRNKQNLLLIADRDRAEEFIGRAKRSHYFTYNIVGAALTDLGEKAPADTDGQDMIYGIPVIGNLDAAYRFALENVIDDVYIEYSGKDIEACVDRFLSMGMSVHVSINEIIPDAPNTTIENIAHHTVITSSIYRMSTKQKVMKRLMDIAGSIVGIILTLVFTVIFGPIIYFQDPGPIFFSQTRVGKNGRRFKIFKFRSMYKDAEERKKELMAQNKMDGLMFKMDNDPRIIPIGRFIRRTSIDEFPQFFNVFIGNMSLVGTRPPTVDEFEQYSEHHKSRLAMKPGITGMWQISGRSDITDFEEVVRLDNEYIRNFSIGLDIKILFRTVIAVFKHEGAE